jgi:aminopeptidase N
MARAHPIGRPGHALRIGSLLGLIMANCWLTPADAVTLGSADADDQSYANVDEFRTTHLELIIDVDFHNRELDGNAVLEMKRLDPKSTQLILDTQDLNILTVSELSADFFGATEKTKPIWVTRPFRLGKTDPKRGTPLFIDLAPSKEAKLVIKIEYETTAKSRALRWRVPEGSKSKLPPFVYTVSGGIGARSWIPLQDTPQVRMNYKALIRTSDDLLAVMGAGNDPKVKRNGNYTFVMTEKVPSYTLALGVGHLEFRPTGTRTGVYAERTVVKEAAKQFSDAEPLLETAEKLLGGYRWQRYDQLVMPNDFGVAGSAYPHVLFASPTLVAGDKGPTAALAYGVGHSWAGELVGIKTWGDRWLNESFSRYLQQRIVTAVYGQTSASLEAVMRARALSAALATCPPNLQVLAGNAQGPQTDAVCGDIIAEKGSLFLTWLEMKFGRERFDDFLHRYFDQFAETSVSTEQFTTYLQTNLLDPQPGLVTRAEVQTWIWDPGLPADAPLPTSAAVTAIDAARADWISGRVPAAKLDTKTWVAQQWAYFLDGLPATLGSAPLAELDKAFALSASPNALIGAAWFGAVIANNDQPAYARLETYLRTVGRGDYLAPLYAALVKTPSGSEFAKRVYGLSRPGYDGDVVRGLDAIVGPVPSPEESVGDSP